MGLLSEEDYWGERSWCYTPHMKTTHPTAWHHSALLQRKVKGPPLERSVGHLLRPTAPVKWEKQANEVHSQTWSHRIPLQFKSMARKQANSAAKQDSSCRFSGSKTWTCCCSKTVREPTLQSQRNMISDTQRLKQPRWPGTRQPRQTTMPAQKPVSSMRVHICEGWHSLDMALRSVAP